MFLSLRGTAISQTASQVRTIVDENGTDLSRDNIFVARPYADSFEAEQKTALLVNAEMQKQYDELIRSVDEAETRLLKNLKALSGWKKEDLRRQVSLAFTDTDGTFYGALSQELESKKWRTRR